VNLLHSNPFSLVTHKPITSALRTSGCVSKRASDGSKHTSRKRSRNAPRDLPHRDVHRQQHVNTFLLVWDEVPRDARGHRNNVPKSLALGFFFFESLGETSCL
jgi:hypothetical protein